MRSGSRSSVTIRIPNDAHERARRLAISEARPTAQVIASAPDRYEREQLIADYRASLDRLYGDPEAAAEYEAEMKAWEDASLADMHESIGDDW